MQDFNHGNSNYITCKPQIDSILVYCNSLSASSPANVHGTATAYCNVGRDFKVTSATVVITYAAGFSIQNSTTFKGKEGPRIYNDIPLNVCISIKKSCSLFHQPCF